MSGEAYVSDCCGALLQVAGRTTRYYVCQRCEKPCDAVGGRQAGDDERKPGGG